MKNIAHRNSIIVIILVAIIGVVIFTLYISPSDEFNRSKIYFEPQGSFSIQTPSSFNFQREKITDDEVVIKVVAPNDVVSANPGLLDIVVYKQADGVELRDQAASFLNIDADRLIPFQALSTAYSYLSQNGQEISYYYFFQNDSNVIVFKFNKTYFDKINPMILVDNSSYANTFLRTLNSIKFN